MRYLLVSAVAVLLAGPALSDPLSFSQAEERALAFGPGLKPAKLTLEAARAQAISAGRLPDPDLSFGVENLPVTGPMAGRLNADSMTMQVVGVDQAVPSGTKRQAQRDRAQSDIEVAAAQTRIAQRDVRVGAALAWIDLYFAERRLAVLDHVIETLGPLWDSAGGAEVASGNSRPAQALEPLQTRASLLDKRSELAAAAGRARAELGLWTGDAEADVSGDPPAFTVDAASLRDGLERNPTQLAFGASERRAEAEVSLARADKSPDWNFEISYGRRDPIFGDMVTARASVSLPLFGARRQDPVISARLADANRVAVERAEAQRKLLAQLDADLADHASHHEQWMRARDVLAPLAQKRADLETASYGAGRAGLSDVLAAFSALADAQLTVLERQSMVVRDGARIALTYGSDDR